MSGEQYDFIIAGAGLAGLSLAHRINRSSLRSKRTLIIDRAEKSANDHTWCFWSDQPGPFDHLVHRKWDSLWFHGIDGPPRKLDIGAEGLEYRMVRASDFYAGVIPDLKDNQAIDILRADVREIADGAVMTDAGKFSAREFVFDSVTKKAYDDPRNHNLLQHFLGWEIEAENDVFDTEAATLFDFRVPQANDCRFVYVLPESSRKALVEFTVFSGSLLERSEYEYALSEYIGRRLGLTSFRNTGEEYGVIPMSDARHETRPSPKVIRIGTAGGYVKPSTGYSFSRTQERLDILVADLESGGTGDSVPVTGTWKGLLDSTMLGVLDQGSVAASDVFESLFAGNPPGRVLRFLDEKTGLLDDLKVMSSVPVLPFTGSFIREAVRRPFR